MRVFGKNTCDGRQKMDIHEETFEGHDVEDISVSNPAEVPLLAITSVHDAEAASYFHDDAADQLEDNGYHPVENADSGSEANDIYDTIHGIYNIGVTKSQDKAALYGRMMHYYAEKATNLPYPPNTRTASVLWYMLIILISNPIIGLYTMGHFMEWDTWVTRDITVIENATDALVQAPQPAQHILADNVFIDGLSTNTHDKVHNITMNQEEFKAISTVATKFSKKVRGYACYELFGELVFALFSLALLCASGMCCTNGRHRAQSMIPIIGLLYTVIYKILAMYILIISLKILVFYTIAAYPEGMGRLPAILLRLLSLSGIDPSNVVHRNAMALLLTMDSYAHKWVIVYCLENIYITISDSIETVHALSKMFGRTIRKMTMRLQRQQELMYFTMGSTSDMQTSNDNATTPSCSYMLLDSLLNKTLGSQETYIHDMYHKGVSDVGTYLDNIDVEQYKDSIARMGPKILSQLRNKDYFT